MSAAHLCFIVHLVKKRLTTDDTSGTVQCNIKFTEVSPAQIVYHDMCVYNLHNKPTNVDFKDMLLSVFIVNSMFEITQAWCIYIKE